MSSQVFYRKWRPQTLSQVAGQEQVTRTLLNALSSGRVSHAYLFCGPRGTGKTSTGRILAKAVNCLDNGGNGEPCNGCAICREVTEGRALDVIEVDAASNRRIDEIRELRERVNYAPSRGRFKVYIIDEVHMLTAEAANALLKTLEEPPPHVIFVLATTEVHKLLPTIVSRCQRFDFHRISQKDITGRLSEICQGEGIKVSTDGLYLIAGSAQGSLRDAENILEQLATFYGRDITLPQVQEVLGLTADTRVRELVKHIVNADVTSGISTIGSIGGDGIDLKQVSRGLVTYLRGLLLVRTGGVESLGLSADDVAELKSLAAKATFPQILGWLKTFGELESMTDSYSTLKLEIAFLDATVGAGEVTVTKAPKAEATSPVPVAPLPRASPQPPEAKKPPVSRIVFGARRPEVETAKAPETPPSEPEAPGKPPISPVAATPQEAPPGTAIPLTAASELERLRVGWKQLIAQVGPDLYRTNAAAFLRSANVNPVSINGDTVTLAFKYPLHSEKMSAPENLRVAEKIISGFLGRPCHVRCTYQPEANHLVEEAQKIGAQITSVEEK